MRSSNADSTIIDDMTQKRQITYMSDFRMQQPEKESASDIDYMTDSDRAQFESLSFLELQVGLTIHRSSRGLSQKEIERQLDLPDTFSSKVAKSLQKLQDLGCIYYEEQPRNNPVMPKVHLYFGMEGRTELLESLSQAVKERDPAIIQYTPDWVTERFNTLESPVPREISARELLLQLRKSTIQKYVSLLKQLLEHGELTSRQASDWSGDSPQTQNNRFARLLKKGFLQRYKKEGSEYYYRFSPGVAEEVANLFKESSQKVEDVKNVESGVNPVSRSHLPDEPSVSTVQVKQPSQPPSTVELLVRKLPEFDPTWSSEVQANWLQAYQQLVGMMQK